MRYRDVKPTSTEIGPNRNTEPVGLLTFKIFSDFYNSRKVTPRIFYRINGPRRSLVER